MIVSHHTAQASLIDCFSKIKPLGSIIFSGSFLGELDKNDAASSVAQQIADVGKRTVVASKCPIYSESVKVSSLALLQFTHPPLSWFDRFDSRTKMCPATNENLFGIFRPN